MLLHDSPEEPGAEAVAADAGNSAAGETTIAAAGVADESKAGPVAKASDVSQAELDVLLARDAGATAGEKPQPAAMATAEPASAPEAAAPVARVAEPEQPTGSGPAIEHLFRKPKGVLAEELEKLVADSNDQPAHSEAPAPASTLEEQQLSEAEGVLAAELAQLVAESNAHAAETRGTESARSNESEPVAPAAPTGPKSSAIVDESASAPPIGAAPAQAQPIVQATSPTAAAQAAAPAAATETAPAEAIAPAATAAEPAIEGTEETEASITGGPARRLLEGLALTVAQLIDFPFRWLGDLDKDIVGVIAFLGASRRDCTLRPVPHSRHVTFGAAFRLPVIRGRGAFWRRYAHSMFLLTIHAIIRRAFECGCAGRPSRRHCLAHHHRVARHGWIAALRRSPQRLPLAPAVREE